MNIERSVTVSSVFPSTEKDDDPFDFSVHIDFDGECPFSIHDIDGDHYRSVEDLLELRKVIGRALREYKKA